MSKIPKLLILAIIVSFVLRFWHLNSLPYPPDGDEIGFGYYGWSILHYGTDEYGKIFPVNFQSIGDYKYPGLAYLNTIPALLFGLSNITTRFWGSISGVSLVIIVYLLSQLLFENRKVSIFAAWFIALSPWAIIESRLGYEPMVSLAIITGAMVCLLRIPKVKHNKYLVGFTFTLFLLASFIYASARFFIPVFLLLLIILSFLMKSFFQRHRKILIIFFISLTLIIGLSLLSAKNRGRASDDIWQRLSSVESNRLQELYVQAGTSQIKIPPRVTWLFHNKYRIAVFDFLERYSEHFSLNFLILSGEASLQRIPDMGVLLFADLIFLPFGFVALIKNKSKPSAWVIFLWLIIAPIPSALTTGEARMNRAILMIVPLAIVSALGAVSMVDIFKNKKEFIYVLLCTGIALSSLYSLNQIFIQKPLDKPWYKQTVNEKLTESILKLKGSYQAVVTRDDDYIFFLFYGKVSPSDFLKRSEIVSGTKWATVNRLDNIYFNMPYRCPLGGKLNVLYVCEGGDVPQNSKIIETFYYPDGIPAYSLIEFYPQSEMLPENRRAALPSNLHYMVDVDHNSSHPDGIIPGKSLDLW